MPTKEDSFIIRIKKIYIIHKLEDILSEFKLLRQELIHLRLENAQLRIENAQLKDRI